MIDSETLINAFIMITEIRNALKSGTKHYRKSDGKLLETDIDVLKTLIDEGVIIFEPQIR